MGTQQVGTESWAKAHWSSDLSDEGKLGRAGKPVGRRSPKHSCAQLEPGERGERVEDPGSRAGCERRMSRREAARRAGLVLRARGSHTEVLGLSLNADGKLLRIFKQPFRAF